MATTTIRLPAEWKAPLLKLRDSLPEAQAQELINTLATRTPEQITALLQTIHQPVTPEAPDTVTSEAGIPASKTATTVATTRPRSSAPLPTRRPMEEKPVEPGKVTIIVRNGNLLADTINGKRYPTDSRIQVTQAELQSIEAELAQRPKYWGVSYTRIERVQPA